MKKGDRYYDPKHRLFIDVTRVSPSGWADIRVSDPATGSDWTKRQPLIDGAFAFAVKEVELTQETA